MLQKTTGDFINVLGISGSESIQEGIIPTEHLLLM